MSASSLVRAKIKTIEKSRVSLGISRSELSRGINRNRDYWSHLMSPVGADNPGAEVVLAAEAFIQTKSEEKASEPS
ncbi:hypothetical protein [Thalassobius sp. I31.1]|uniref:hypothetical protein n=1 Tax=Thalassobius sp. I31.1 TaxID=2109912 RepID=UPI000D1AD41D|nr:hypothetical protein [Thalassobius sp. I31.1]